MSQKVLVFTQENDVAGYRVILRPNEEAINGQLVVAKDSPLQSLNDLAGKDVGFPSRTAFVAYMVTMDHLTRSGVEVIPVYGANQEGVMGQLKAGAVAAASVNSKIMRNYSERNGFPYRVLWSSPDYLNLAILAQSRVPSDVAERIRKVMDNMDSDPEGLAILKSSGEAINMKPPYGFRRSEDRDYENYRIFYKATVLKKTEH